MVADRVRDGNHVSDLGGFLALREDPQLEKRNTALIFFVQKFTRG